MRSDGPNAGREDSARISRQNGVVRSRTVRAICSGGIARSQPNQCKTRSDAERMSEPSECPDDRSASEPMKENPSFDRDVGRVARDLEGAKQTDSSVTDDEFIRLFGRHQAAIHSFLLGAVFNHSDADDLLQDVNIALWRKRADYDPAQPFLRWALGFARLQVTAHRRRKGTTKLVFSDEAVNALAMHWTAETGRHDQRLEALADCIQGLDEQDNRLLGQRYGTRTPAAAIAEERSVPVASVYKTLDRLRRVLRGCVERRIAQLQHVV